MATAEGFEGWAILEIMGHRQVAGFVSDVALFGARMARVEVPGIPSLRRKRYRWSDELHREVEEWETIPEIPAFTHYYSGQSIFSCVPATEELVRAAAARFRTQPPQPLTPSSHQLGAADGPPDADVVDDDDLPAPKCEGCDNPATTSDGEGVPLCDECYDALPDANDGPEDSQKEKAEGGGAAGEVVGAPTDGEAAASPASDAPAPPPEARSS